MSPAGSTPILVTGAAGFIGFHVARRLLAAGTPVHGVDNLNDYYDPALKLARLAELEKLPGFTFQLLDLADREMTARLFAELRPRHVVHMAAQAGVRYSIANPQAYVDANLVGFMNVLEGCRQAEIAHLVYASSSSVYGANTTLPYSTRQNVDHPLSLYAATKKANELMAHSYSHLFRLPTTGLRFFTVYGPWGRPDMAMFLFTDALFKGQPIEMFNNGAMRRDFTFIDDVVEGVVRLIDRPATPNPDRDSDAPDPGTSAAPYRIFNIGNSEPITLMRLVEVLEQATNHKADIRLKPMQAGDVRETYADVKDLVDAVDFAPRTSIENGAVQFVEWYRSYYGLPLG